MRVDCHCDTALWLLQYPSLLELPAAQQDYQRISKYLDLAFMDIFINENLLSQVGIMACSIPHGFPFGRISDVSNRPIQFSDCRQPAQMHRCRYIRAEWR